MRPVISAQYQHFCSHDDPENLTNLTQNDMNEGAFVVVVVLWQRLVGHLIINKNPGPAAGLLRIESWNLARPSCQPPTQSVFT